MFQVIDNLASETLAGRLENMCKTEMFWSFSPNTSGVDKEELLKLNVPGANYDGPQYGFAHWALHPNGETSHFFEKVFPLIYALEEKTGVIAKEVYRIRVALTTTVGKPVQHFPHVDLNKPHKVLLYYVNDSDGDTFMFNETYSPEDEDLLPNLTLKERVEPKRNRAILFDGLTYHNSSSPVNNNERYIINIDFN
jgi:hypothetical protein